MHIILVIYHFLTNSISLLSVGALGYAECFTQGHSCIWDQLVAGVGSFACLVPELEWLARTTGSLAEHLSLSLSSYILSVWPAWASSQHGSLKVTRLFTWWLASSRANMPRGSKQSLRLSYDLISEVTKSFYFALLAISREWRKKEILLLNLGKTCIQGRKELIVSILKTSSHTHWHTLDNVWQKNLQGSRLQNTGYLRKIKIRFFTCNPKC